MAPTRLGVIGLSADPTAWATAAHVGPLRSSPLSDAYTITALATSSPNTAKSAAEFHKIPTDKAYSSAKDIADDPDVDMVVVSVKLPLHKELIIPALNAKKDVCVEWPLGNGLQQAEELAALAKKQGVKTIVCLQSRTLPIVLKAKEIIDSGALGRIITTSLVASSSMFLNYPEKARYINDKSSGADNISIASAHILDPLCFLLGEFASLNATTTIRFPTTQFTRSDGTLTDPEPRACADSVAVQGLLESGISVSFSNTTTTAATPGHLEWIISGEKGSLRFSGDGPFMALSAPKLYQYLPKEEVHGWKFEGFESAGGEAQWAEVDVAARPAFGGIGGVYQAFAEGRSGNYVDFEGAVKRHRMVEAIYRSAEKGTRESY